TKASSRRRTLSDRPSATGGGNEAAAGLGLLRWDVGGIARQDVWQNGINSVLRGTAIPSMRGSPTSGEGRGSSYRKSGARQCEAGCRTAVSRPVTRWPSALAGKPTLK